MVFLLSFVSAEIDLDLTASEEESCHEICQVLELILLSNRFLYSINIPHDFMCSTTGNNKVSESKSERYFTYKSNTISFQR